MSIYKYICTKNIYDPVFLFNLKCVLLLKNRQQYDRILKIDLTSKGLYMKDKNIIATIVLVLLIICLLILAFLNLLKLQGQESPANINKMNNVILPQTNDAGESYIDKIYFVGDSTTYHFKKANIDENHLLVPESLTLMLDSSICDIFVGNTGLTIPEAIKDYNAEIVIITLGVNGADRFTEVAYKTYYNKLINAITKASPSTQIILQSVFPVAKWYSDQNIGITNTGIDRINGWLKEIALENGLPYLDTQSILKDKNGAMISEYDEGDGVHMNEKGYQLIVEYIKTHAYK